MCVCVFRIVQRLIFFTSTQRSPFPAGIATEPLPAAIHPHPDVSSLNLQPDGHVNARGDDTKDKREAKPEGYGAFISHA